MIWDYTLETREQVTTCNLCESERSYELSRLDRYGYEAPSRQCADCGLVWLSPRMTAEGYARFYAEGAYRRLVSKFHGRRIDEETVKEDQRGYADNLKIKVLGDAKWKSVLDVGGSTGTVGRAFGSNVTVLDPAPLELAQADGLERIASTVEEWQPGKRWELVLVCRAVDHFLDPMSALINLRGALAYGGRMWIDAVSWPRVATRHGSQSRAMKIDHPFAFEEGTLKRMLIKAGFAPMRSVHEGDHVGFVCA